MKLTEIRLNNFQGIRELHMQFYGTNARIYGDNATGKTTLFNAVTWLLFDRASTGSKGFTPKTQGEDGDVHNLSHEAEAEFMLSNNRTLKLKKSYHEVWQRKRGSITEEFTGHTTDYYVDDVPVKEKEYTRIISDIGDIEQLRMLSMPYYFPEAISWMERRKILLGVCGDISDEEVIQSDKELAAAFMSVLDGRSVEDYQKIAAATKSKINKELEGIPGRIDEAQRAIPEIGNLSIDMIDTKIGRLQAQKSEQEAAKAAALSGDTAQADIRRRIAELKAEATEIKSAYMRDVADANADIQAEILRLQSELHDKKQILSDIESKQVSTTAKIDRMAGLREALVDEYTAIQGESWDASAELCPTCGQDLPYERVDALREEFNQKKSDRLEAINARGRAEANKETIEQLRLDMDALAEDAQRMREEIALYEKTIEKEKAALITAQFEDAEDYAAYAEIQRKIGDCRESMRSGSANLENAAAPYSKEIAALSDKIRSLEAERSKIILAQIQRERIAELEVREKELAREYEQFERGVCLCERFIKTKVRMLDERINGRFETVRFRLFKEQINGGLSEDCEVLIPSPDGALVPFKEANNAARINAGLEIIDTLSHVWNISMPVFVDNAESVTAIREIGAQTIALIVSEDDKELRLKMYDKFKTAV